MTIKKLTETEFNAIVKLQEGLEAVLKLGGTLSNIDFFFNGDIETDETELSSLDIDLRHSEILNAIKRFKSEVTEVKAVDSDGVGFHVVEIIFHDYENIFGYVVNSDGEKEYHYCQSVDGYNDELERDETHFMVDDSPVILDDCVRTGGGF